MKTRFLTLFAAIMMVATVWANGIEIDGICYVLEGDSAIVTYKGTSVPSGNDYSGAITIPSLVTYNQQTYRVTSIGMAAFYGCIGLQSITIPNSVTSIGADAFYGCTGLQSITIPNSVTSIGGSAFNDCSSLSSITIPNSVTSIGEDAFNDCSSLSSVTIPNSVTSIGYGAFSNCTGLTSINVDVVNKYYASEDGVLFNYAKDSLIQYPTGNTRTTYTIPNSVTSVRGGAFAKCNKLSSIIISNNMTSIGEGAFSNCTGLQSVTIPNSVKSIGNYAFYICPSLISITIPNSVTSIGEGAFRQCISLTSITIPNSVKSIGDFAFNDCSSLSSITIPNGVTSIGHYAFVDCTGLTSITIPNSVTSIGNYAFDGCTSLSSITIPNSVTSIGEGAFRQCISLTSITIPNSVKSIGDFAFLNCPKLSSINVDAANKYYSSMDGVLLNFAKDTLIQYPTGNTHTTYTVPNSVTSIGNYAFEGCTSLSSITIPNSVTSIGNYAFEGCTSLPVVDNIRYADTYLIGVVDKSQSSYTIREGTRWIGNYAFCGCTSLTSITCFAAKPPTCCMAGFCVKKSIPVYVPGKSLDLYKQAPEWKDFTNLQILWWTVCGESLYWEYNTGKLLISGTGSMYNYTEDSIPWLQLRDSVQTIVIEDSCISIGDYAFYKFSNLVSVSLPPMLTSIGQYAFANCNKLKAITLNPGLLSVAANAFANDAKLYEITCLAQDPPTIQPNSFANYMAYLYVPCDAKKYYKITTGWSSFVNMSCVSAEEEPTTDVKVVPTDNTVTITWPTNTNADNYTIEIDKDGITFCTLTFNAQGQLTNIAFAPGRGSSNDIAMAEAVAGGYKFTITSLNSGTKYNYEIDTQNASGTSIANYTGTFTTTGVTALDQLPDSPSDRFTKIIKDGQLFILRNGKTYNAQGGEL